MTRRNVILWSGILTGVILIASAAGISHNAEHDLSEPTITASPDVTLPVPEPPITASPEAKLPAPKPGVEAVPAPATTPDNIPSDPYVSTPQYQPPFTAPQVPLPAPQTPPVAPNVPTPIQPLPPVATEPLEPILRPLRPITDPLLGTVKDIIPHSHHY
jgi:hypothetical protein